ncbi:hypothetical protein OSB04_004958 [Centaurea solstitialis]|uniref:PIFI-like Ig-like domain-containing protein n=1 Tax=Centaurea solstitialis TaxID=347529 RepID=A0AA38TF24_9ASTR|nr:hypothetical protein OSB04_004958 [Centaurea solstitialis]
MQSCTPPVCENVYNNSPIFQSWTQIVSTSHTKSTTNFTPFIAKHSWSEVKISGKIRAAATTVIEASPAEEVKDFVLPSWAEFDIGRAPVYWKTMNGLPPSSVSLRTSCGFNQPIMCGGEPRAMLRKDRGKADPPFYTIQICVPKHAVNLIFSFTNGSEWDGPYRLQFQVPKAWRNKDMDFFNKGLTEELSREGACEEAIFPDTSIVIDRCQLMGNLTSEGADRCELDLVTGCTDPGSSDYNPLANVDDGSCPPYSDSED